MGQLLARSPETSALVRTTAAVTLLSGGTAQNVLPQSGNITINFRHLPGAGCTDVVVGPPHTDVKEHSVVLNLSWLAALQGTAPSRSSST